jgi:hypothetical protein
VALRQPLWSEAELEAAVQSYCDMLLCQERGLDYSKAERRRELAPRLRGRTKTSIEKRHQNISAALIELHLPWIHGYKPLGHGIAQVLPVLVRRLEQDRTLIEAMAQSVALPVPQQLVATGRLRLTKPPAGRAPRLTSHEGLRPAARRPAGCADYLALEARNAALGRAGEMLVLAHERDRLQTLGRHDLARKIVHMALEDDGAGYDILSFEVDARERLIEVKTTTYGAETPFFVSACERDVSVVRDDEYQLYRVFKLRQEPSLFTLRGRLDETCDLDAVSFRGRVA